LILVHFKFINIDDGSCHIAQHPVKQVKRSIKQWEKTMQIS
jgi:hypothetical protein